MFDYAKIQSSAAAAIGALFLSASCILAAVGPATAMEGAPAHSAAQAQVSDRADA